VVVAAALLSCPHGRPSFINESIHVPPVTTSVAITTTTATTATTATTTAAPTTDVILGG